MSGSMGSPSLSQAEIALTTSLRPTAEEAIEKGCPTPEECQLDSDKRVREDDDRTDHATVRVPTSSTSPSALDLLAGRRQPTARSRRDTSPLRCPVAPLAPTLSTVAADLRCLRIVGSIPAGHQDLSCSG